MYSNAQDSRINNETVENSFNPSEVLKAGFQSWQSQLDFIKQGGFNGIFTNSDLKLISYETSQPKIGLTLDEFRHKAVSMIAIDDKRGINVLEDFEAGVNAYYNGLKNNIINYYDSLDMRLGVVKLNWKYKDRKLQTYCVVSDALGAIIYDDFLSNIFIVSSYKGRDVYLEGNKENTGNTDDYLFGEVLKITSPIGSKLAEAKVLLKIDRKPEDDSLSITSYSFDKCFQCMPFWNASSDGSIVSFKRGKDSHVSFSYNLVINREDLIIDGKKGVAGKWGLGSSNYIVPSTMPTKKEFTNLDSQNFAFDGVAIHASN